MCNLAVSNTHSIKSASCPCSKMVSFVLLPDENRTRTDLTEHLETRKRKRTAPPNRTNTTQLQLQKIRLHESAVAADIGWGLSYLLQWKSQPSTHSGHRRRSSGAEQALADLKSKTRLRKTYHCCQCDRATE